MARVGVATARAVLVLVLAVVPGANAADALDDALQAATAGQQDAARSQQRIDGLADEARNLGLEYRDLTRQQRELAAYNDQLEKLVAAQKQELDGYAEETAAALRTRAHALPLMREMLRALDQFVRLDAPFLDTERRQRVDDLSNMLGEPDTTLAEKYRRLVEAWRVEAEYGRDLEAYSATLELDGAPRTVDVLRAGRVGLFYLSFDRDEAGYWDAAARVWRKLPRADHARIARGLAVARKQVPPQLLTLPLLAVEPRK